jgi:hypothetical protein
VVTGGVGAATVVRRDAGGDAATLAGRLPLDFAGVLAAAVERVDGTARAAVPFRAVRGIEVLECKAGGVRYHRWGTAVN